MAERVGVEVLGQFSNRLAPPASLDSIHVLRATAILLMIQVHFVENLSSPQGDRDVLYAISSALGMLSAPIFTFLVGLSLWLWLQKNGDANGLGVANAKRGAAIVFIGLVFAAAIWLPREVFHWDILPLIGFSTLILYPLRRWPPLALALLALAALVAAALLRDGSGYTEHREAGWYVYEFTISDTLLGLLLNGYFPLLPWIAFPLAGFATGKAFFDFGGSRTIDWRLPAIGVALGAATLLALVATRTGTHSLREFVGGISFYPASTAYVLLTASGILVALWVLHVALDQGAPKDGPTIRFFRRYSMFSLSAYVIHHAIHLWPLYLAAIASGQDTIWHFYHSAMSPTLALLLAIAFIAAFYPVLVWWEPHRGWSLEGWLRSLRP